MDNKFRAWGQILAPFWVNLSFLIYRDDATYPENTAMIQNVLRDAEGVASSTNVGKHNHMQKNAAGPLPYAT